MRTLFTVLPRVLGLRALYEFLLQTPAAPGTAFPLTPCKLINSAKENYTARPGKSVV